MYHEDQNYDFLRFEISNLHDSISVIEHESSQNADDENLYYELIRNESLIFETRLTLIESQVIC